MLDLFSIPMLKENINLNPDDYYNQIVNLRNSRGSERFEYTSFYDQDTMAGMQWEELRREIELAAIRYMTDVCPTNNNPGTPKVIAWWNLYGEQNHHCWHDHSGHDLAGTYYVHMDEHTPGIEFSSPLAPLINASIAQFGVNTRFRQTCHIQPSPGELLIWPSWLSHMIPEQKTFGDKLRCTISFNIRLEKDLNNEK